MVTRWEVPRIGPIRNRSQRQPAQTCQAFTFPRSAMLLLEVAALFSAIGSRATPTSTGCQPLRPASLRTRPLAKRLLVDVSTRTGSIRWRIR